MHSSRDVTSSHGCCAYCVFFGTHDGIISITPPPASCLLFPNQLCWLPLQVNVRAAAKELGLKAIKQASVLEQRERALTQQRKSHRVPLASKEDLRAAAAAVANGWLLPHATGQLCSPTAWYWAAHAAAYGIGRACLCLLYT